MRKLLSLLLALALALTISGGALAAGSDLGGGLGTELQNTGAMSASGEATAEEAEPKDVVVVEAGAYESLTVGENEELRGPNGELVTMTIGGVQTDIVSGESYAGDILLTLTDETYLYGPNMGSVRQYEQRAALYLHNGAKVDALSVDAAVSPAGVIRSEGTNFNGVMLTGDDGSAAAVSDIDIDFYGWGENDMGGVGAGLYIVGPDMTANVSDMTIRTHGATRTAVFTGGDSEANLTNVHVFAFGGELPEGTGDLNNMEVPWMLGLIGDCRATNALGGTRTTWTDSTIVSRDWGAMSTDSIGSGYAAGTQAEGGHVELTTHNCYIATLYCGYGAYADGGAQDRFYNSVFDVADMALIMTGSGEGTFDGSYVNAGSNAVMVHAGGGGVINAIGSVFRVGGTAFLIKDSKMTVNIDNSAFFFDGTAACDPAIAALFGLDTSDEIFDYETYDRALYNDLTATNIVKVQHNADAGSGSDASQEPVVVNVTDSVLEGDFLNTCADTLTVTTFMMGNAVTRDRPSRSLELNLTDSAVTGAISLGEDEWSSNELVTLSGGVNDFQYASGTTLGFYTDGEHGLTLTMQGAEWTPTETCYLTKLVLDESSVIHGVLTVDGQEVPLAPGVYEGELTVAPVSARLPSVATVDGEIYVLLDDVLSMLGK